MYLIINTIVFTSLVFVFVFNKINITIGSFFFVTANVIAMYIYMITNFTVFGKRIIETIFYGFLLIISYLPLFISVSMSIWKSALLYFCALLIFIINVFFLKKIKLNGLTALDAISKFAKSWMDQESVAFDELLDKVGKRHVAKISVYHITNENDDSICTFIIPYIHPGPLRQIGSGELPSILYSALYDLNPFVVHGASNHSFNLTSRRESIRIVNLIRDCVKNKEDRGKELEKLSFSCGENGKIQISKYRFGENFLFFVSKVNSTEDLPNRVVCAVDERTDIVDRHNGICDENEAIYTESEETQVLELIALLKASQDREIKIREVGYGYTSFHTEDIGPGGIRVLSFFGSNNITFISIDSNNLACGIAQRIQQEAEKLGFSLSEVVTTDNHWNTGGKKHRLGYKPGGSTDGVGLLNAVKEALLMSKRNAQRAKFNRSVIAFETKIVGDEAMISLKKAADKGTLLVMLSFLSSAVLGLLVILW